jgi:hypothetical protein
MMSVVRRLRNAILEMLLRDPRTARIERAVDDAKILLGKQVARLRPECPQSWRDVEFRVFSQFGDDGIIDYLAERIRPAERFVELGTGDYTESNTRFLLINRLWDGFICDGNTRLMNRVRRDTVTWQFGLTVCDRFITKDNVNGLLQEHGFTGELGLLSIDLDGIDWFVWDALTVVSPAIVVMEYNAVFGGAAPVSVPYDAAFERFAREPTGLYWGVSLPALCVLAERKGYALVGCNSGGNNAYFVRADLVERLPAPLRRGAFVDARFRDSRGPDGSLTHLSGRARLDAIAHMPVIDVTTGRTLPLTDALAAY